MGGREVEVGQRIGFSFFKQLSRRMIDGADLVDGDVVEFADKVCILLC